MLLPQPMTMAANANALPNANIEVNPVGTVNAPNTNALAPKVVLPMPTPSNAAVNTIIPLPLLPNVPVPNELQLALVWMGFTQDTAEYITDNQGMSLLDKFHFLMDDEAETLCKVL